MPTHRPPTHPGEVLLNGFLEPLEVSQVEAASRINIPFQRLNAIVKGRRSGSADTALLLEALTGWDAQIWLTLQAKWDLWHATKARGPKPEVHEVVQDRVGQSWPGDTAGCYWSCRRRRNTRASALSRRIHHGFAARSSVGSSDR